MQIPFVSIVGTTECDACCAFCKRWREPIITMNPGLTCNLIGQLPGVGTKVVDITGGQPGLWNGTAAVLKACQREHLLTSVTVSGPSALNLLPNLSLIHYLRISVHGTPANHDRFQGEGFWQANLEFLRAASEYPKQHRKPELIFTVRDDHDEEDFRAVNQLARQFRIRVIGNIDWRLGFSPQILRLINRYRRRPYWVFSLSKIRYWRCGGNNRFDPTCAADRMLVWYGDSIVQPCMEYRHILPAIPLDRESKLADILNSPERRSWRPETGRWPECHGCIISCPNVLGLATKWHRYATWLHLPTFAQGFRDCLLLAAERSFRIHI